MSVTKYCAICHSVNPCTFGCKPCPKCGDIRYEIDYDELPHKYFEDDYDPDEDEDEDEYDS